MHDHAHGHGHAHGREAAGRGLAIALGLTASYLAVEVIAGLWTGSLALLADAGHMLTDVGGLALSLFAVKLAQRPATPRRTYGLYRAEILAALGNAVVLLASSVFILYEAYRRLLAPPAVNSGPMMIVAIVGLGVNVAGVYALRHGRTGSLNVQGAYLELVSDAVASVGVITAAAIMSVTGWYLADPIVSAAIALYIVPRTWSLLREAVGILLEGTPADVDVAALRGALEDLEGVDGVHDLHVWSLTSGVHALSAHVVRAPHCEWDVLLDRVHGLCRGQFKIQHVTIQLEPAGWESHETHL